MKVWKYKIPGALNFKKAANFPGFDPDLCAAPCGELVLEYSILMSVVKLNHDIASQKRVECALIFATIGSFKYVCKCPLHASPIFQKKKASKLPCFDTKFAPL